MNRGKEEQAPTNVDVLVPSLKGLSNEFEEHLRSRIPVHCILTSSVIGPARARQELMDRVDTDWFAFVDDDVKLRPNWWSTVTGMIDPGVGAVEASGTASCQGSILSRLHTQHLHGVLCHREGLQDSERCSSSIRSEKERVASV